MVKKQRKRKSKEQFDTWVDIKNEYIFSCYKLQMPPKYKNIASSVIKNANQNYIEITSHF